MLGVALQITIYHKFFQMAATLRDLQSQIRSWRQNPWFYDAHIPPAWGRWKKNYALAKTIMEEWLGFLSEGKTSSPDISNLPEVLKNLRTSVQWPCCDILNTPEQK
jgi:hypothetical protein